MPLLDKYPFLVNYFEKGIKNPEKSIAHSILFYGNDLTKRREIAKISCMWIFLSFGGRKNE